MLDAAVLVQCVMDGLSAGREAGHFRDLRRYERWRKPANQLMISLLNGIQQAFQPSDQGIAKATVLKALRTSALNMADNLSPLNRQCMRSAMGLSGELPELAQGRLPGVSALNSG